MNVADPVFIGLKQLQSTRNSIIRQDSFQHSILMLTKKNCVYPQISRSRLKEISPNFSPFPFRWVEFSSHFFRCRFVLSLASMPKQLSLGGYIQLCHLEIENKGGAVRSPNVKCPKISPQGTSKDVRSSIEARWS